MRKHPAIALPCLLLLMCVAVTVIAQLQQQNTARSKQIREERYSHYPLVDYNIKKVLTKDKQARKKVKEKRYKNELLTVAPEVSSFATTHWEDALSPIPTAQSDAVIVGTVDAAEAVLSDDKSTVFSEFSVRVEGVIKNQAATPINTADVITLSREGGRVRMPDGTIREYIVARQDMPRIGKRYIFFLQFLDVDHDYKILTGYQLNEGVVLPLDGSGKFQQNKGKKEDVFLREVQ